MVIKRTKGSPVEFGSEFGAFQTLQSHGNSSCLTSLAKDSLKGGGLLRNFHSQNRSIWTTSRC